MNIDKLPLGDNPPFDFNVVVEIPQGGHPVKYELDKKSGAMYVDRFLNTSMTYPANYGFIPHTLAADGDPCDVLVLDRSPVVPGAIIRARPIGALVMTDEAGADDKIIAVPLDKLNPYYGDLKSLEELPKVLRNQVAHFFQHYKDLEKGKWVAGLHWVGYDEALALLVEGILNGPLARQFKLSADIRKLMDAHPRGIKISDITTSGRAVRGGVAATRSKKVSPAKAKVEVKTKAVSVTKKRKNTVSEKDVASPKKTARVLAVKKTGRKSAVK